MVLIAMKRVMPDGSVPLQLRIRLSGLVWHNCISPACFIYFLDCYRHAIRILTFQRLNLYRQSWSTIVILLCICRNTVLVEMKNVCSCFFMFSVYQVTGPVNGGSSQWWGQSMVGPVNGGASQWWGQSMVGPVNGGSSLLCSLAVM